MRRVSLVPNLITAFSLACGLFVIFKVNLIEPGRGNYDLVYTSTLLLLLAALADFFDGALARVIHAESEFGLVFDSLADSISFGVAPSVLMLKTLSLEQGTLLSFFAASSAMVYSLCGVLRLVRFNVRAAEIKGNVELESAQKKHFTGLPIPAAAAATVSVNLFLLSPRLGSWSSVVLGFRSEILIFVMLLTGYLMVCRLKFPSMKMLYFRIPSFHILFCTVIVSVVILYGILYFFALVLFTLSWVYILVALILALIRCLAGKKSKTLEEFEPEDTDSFS